MTETGKNWRFACECNRCGYKWLGNMNHVPKKCARRGCQSSDIVMSPMKVS
jgi:hypothetical protein